LSMFEEVGFRLQKHRLHESGLDRLMAARASERRFENRPALWCVFSVIERTSIKRYHEISANTPKA